MTDYGSVYEAIRAENERLRSELLHTRRTLETCRLSMAELQQELDAQQRGTWQPVEDGVSVSCGCGNDSCDVAITSKFGILIGMGRHYRRGNASTQRLYLPDGHALCRLVPGAPEPKEDDCE